MLKGDGFLRIEADGEGSHHTLAAHHRRDREADPADAAVIRKTGAHGQHFMGVFGDGLDDHHGGEGDGEVGVSLVPHDAHAGVFGFLGEQMHFFQGYTERRAADGGGRDRGHLAVAMFAQHIRSYVQRMDIAAIGEQGAKAQRVEKGAGAKDTFQGQAAEVLGQLRHHIHGIRHDNEDGIWAGEGEGFDDGTKQFGIRVDSRAAVVHDFRGGERQDHHIRVGGFLHAAGGDGGGASEATGMAEVESVADAGFFGPPDQHKFGGQTLGNNGESDRFTDAANTDDADFHEKDLVGRITETGDGFLRTVNLSAAVEFLWLESAFRCVLGGEGWRTSGVSEATQELVARARHHDADAFAELIERYEQAALAVAYAVLRDADRAGDAVQEAFLHAWSELGRLQEAAKFGGWLMRIVRNAALDLRRKQKPTVAAYPEIAAETADPASRGELRERDARVQEALNGLEETTRMAVILRYYDGRSAREIADLLDLSPAAVDMRLSRGRSQLKESLADVAEEEIGIPAHPRTLGDKP